MYIILIISYLICTDASSTTNKTALEAQNLIQKYLNKIPDIQSQYVLNEGLSKSIARYFSGKISVLPLFKMSVIFDRRPVKIPWTMARGVIKTAPNAPYNPKIKYSYKRLSRPPKI